MSNSIVSPGSFVYTAGRGLGVVLGKKTMTIASLGDVRELLWDIRGLGNLQSPHAIPVAKINNGAIRSLADKETLLAAFDKIINPAPIGNLSNSYRENALKKGVASADPADVAQVIGALTKRYRDGKQTILSVPKQDRDVVEQAVGLLADDLAMAAGLSFTAAAEHIKHLAFSLKPANLWPLQARDAKSSMLDEETFKTAFGIDFEQADDLDANPPVIEPKDIVSYDGRSRDKSTQAILSFLERGAATAMSPKLHKNLGRNSHMQPLFQEIAALSPSRGVSKTALEFAFIHLGGKEIIALAYSDLVRGDERLSLSGLAEKLSMSEDDAGALLAQARQNYIAAAEKKNERVFAELIGKAGADKENKKEHMTSYQYTTRNNEANYTAENKEIYASYTDSVSDRGPGRGAFELAAATMCAHSFAIITPLYFVARDKRPTIDELAAQLNIDSTQIAIDIKDAIKEFSGHAVAAERGSYITLDMATINPDVAEWRVPHKKWTKKSNVERREETSSVNVEAETVDPVEVSQENNAQDHSEEDAQIIEPTSFDHVSNDTVSDEASVIEHIRNNGFDSESLENLGVIYEAKSDWQHALYLYGAARDLDENGNLWLIQRVERMEAKLGRKYSTEMHFPLLEKFIQDRLDGVSENDNVIDAEFVDITLESDAPASEPRPDYNFERHSQPEEGGGKTVPATSPRITYGIPPEALVPGQRLKMVFKQMHDGCMEVTMEVELTKPEIGKGVHRGNGFDARNGLDVAFEQTADGQAHVSINGHDYSPERPYQREAKP